MQTTIHFIVAAGLTASTFAALPSAHAQMPTDSQLVLRVPPPPPPPQVATLGARIGVMQPDFQIEQSTALVSNRVMTNGLMANGLMANGLMANGLMANGLMANGPNTNGSNASTNRGVSDVSKVTPRVQSILLPNGRELKVRSASQP
jgi:hypothetical protein